MRSFRLPAPSAFVLLALGLTLSAVAPAAHAADPRNVKEADQRFREGVRLMNAGKPDEARLQFAEANALVRSTDILWNLIAAEGRSSHYADALNHARQFVRDPKAPPNEVRDTNAKIIPENAQKVGQLEIEAPAGAQLEVDSKEKAGHAPLLDPYAVTPGPHQVVAITGTDRFTKDIDVAAGQTLHVTLGPPPVVATVPPPVTSPALVTTPAPLDHAGDTAPPPPPSDPADATTYDHRRKTQLWVTVGLGAGAVLLAAGSAIFFGLAQSSKDSASNIQGTLPPGTGCPGSASCADLSNDLHNQNDQFHIGEGLAIGAGVVAVGAVVSWIALRPHHDSVGSLNTPTLRLVPSVNPSQPGFLVQGSF